MKYRWAPSLCNASGLAPNLVKPIIYRPSLYSLIATKFNRADRMPFSRRISSVVQRPYKFHIGTSWAGKPLERGKRLRVPFASDSAVGAWRDKTLSRRKGVLGK